MQIFGKEILLKRFGCNLNDEPGLRVLPPVNIFVKVTNGCNAHCSFCSNAGTMPSRNPFNIAKLTSIIHELRRERFVDLEDIRIETIPHVYFTRSMNRGRMTQNGTHRIR